MSPTELKLTSNAQACPSAKSTAKPPRRKTPTDHPNDIASTCSLADVEIGLIGEAAGWFRVAREDGAIVVTPVKPLPRRCTIRPVALFEQRRGFPDANTVMGKLVFENGCAEARRYIPFTRDPDRQLRALFLPVEAMPEDDWPVSRSRWNNFQAIAKRLLNEAGMAWPGLPRPDLDDLMAFGPWPEPLEGCLLHALVQATCHRGGCVIEIGSFRGRSASAIAMALRSAGSDSLLISVDPHLDQPHNAQHVRTALAQLGEEARLVQFSCGSDRAAKLLRPESASLVFVDGDHSARQVLSDFQNYADLVAPGGYMVFHDYGYGNHNGLPEADPDVRRVVDEHVLTDSRFTPLLLAHTQLALVKR